MIDFRYHLVSIIAVFFALAVGIVLGAGPLGETVEEDLPGQLETMSDRNRDLQNELLAFETSQEYQQEFVDLVADELVSERLTDESVLVIGLPGASGSRLEDVSDMLERSGATVTGTMEVESSWTDPESEAALDTLAAELTTRPLNADADGYVRGAEVLADAVLTSLRPEDLPVDPPAGPEGTPGDASEFMVEESVVAGFSDAGFVDVEGDLSTKANVAVVVAEPTEVAEPPAEGGEQDEASESEGEPEEWFNRMVQFVAVLDEAARGVVVAGERDVAAGHDVIGIIRSDDDLDGDISTVDSVELETGQVAVVYAVAEQADGGSGHYGLTDSAGALSPPIPAVPEPPATTEPPEPPEGEENAEGGDSGADGEGEGSGSDGEGEGSGSEGETDGDGGDGADAQDGGPDEDDAVGAGVMTGEGEAL